MWRKNRIRWVCLAVIVAVLLVKRWREGPEGIGQSTFALPAVVEETMPAAIARFEAALAAHAPDVLASLQPGLSPEKIAELEAASGIKLTDELRALYQWRNGVPEQSNIAITPVHRFLSLEDTLASKKAEEEQLAQMSATERATHDSIVGYIRHWVPIFQDLAGDGYFYDPTRSPQQGQYFESFLETGTFEVYPSLANLLVALSECYETKAYFVDNDGRVNADFEAAGTIHAKYSAPGTW